MSSSTTLSSMDRVSLAITNASVYDMDQEFITSLLIYLVEHSPVELVDQAIASASKEWDL